VSHMMCGGTASKAQRRQVVTVVGGCDLLARNHPSLRGPIACKHRVCQEQLQQNIARLRLLGVVTCFSGADTCFASRDDELDVPAWS
jgi:hypothetical protein